MVSLLSHLVLSATNAETGKSVVVILDVAYSSEKPRQVIKSAVFEGRRKLMKRIYYMQIWGADFCLALLRWELPVGFKTLKTSLKE